MATAFQSLSLLLRPYLTPYNVFLAIVSYLVCWLTYTLKWHPLASLPGPVWAKISRVWQILQVAQGNQEQNLLALHRQHGPVVRIAPNEVSVSDPSMIPVIYGTNGVFVKTDFYTVFEPWISNRPVAFTMQDENLHTKHKRIVGQLYSKARIMMDEDRVDQVSDTLTVCMRHFADTGSCFELRQWLQRYTTDVLGELFFGGTFHALDLDRDVRAEMALQQSTMLLFSLLGVASLPSYIRRLLMPAIMVVPSMRRGFIRFNGIVEKAKKVATSAVETYQENEAGRTDILHKLVKLVLNKGHEVDFSVHDVAGEVFGALTAGSDTTAIALTAIIYHLVRHPVALTKLLQEIDEATRSGELSESVPYVQAVKLPYLVACCKEGMRLHPSVGMTLPRVTPARGAVLAGSYIAPGMQVGISPAVVQRDRRVFGLDSDEYNPERWLGDPARVAEMDRSMLQFGSGKRSCTGQGIAILQIYKIVALLLNQFEFSLPQPTPPWRSHTYFFNIPLDIDIYVSHRKRGYRQRLLRIEEVDD